MVYGILIIDTEGESTLSKISINGVLVAYSSDNTYTYVNTRKEQKMILQNITWLHCQDYYSQNYCCATKPFIKCCDTDRSYAIQKCLCRLCSG